MTEDAWQPNSRERQIVLQTLTEVSRHRGWILMAAHFRSTHIHVVIQAETKPEPILHAFKSYSSRALSRDHTTKQRWARHGSTVYLWTSEEIAKAMTYVLENQGDPMDMLSPWYPDRPNSATEPRQ